MSKFKGPSKKLSRKMRRAFSHWVLRYKFMASLVLRPRVIYLEDHPRIRVAATDGTFLVFNCKGMERLTEEQVIGVLGHEILHCVYNHQGRMHLREPLRWNIACDYAVNRDLKELNVELPPGVVEDVNDEYEDLISEEIYNRLAPITTTIVSVPGYKPLDDDGDGEGGRSGDGDGGEDGDEEEDSEGNSQGKRGNRPNSNATGGEVCPEGSLGPLAEQAGISPQDVKDAQQGTDWRSWAIEAVKNAGSDPGDVPAGVRLQVDSYKTPAKVPWRAALSAFFISDKTDISWSRPSRRFAASGLYLPSRQGDILDEIVVSVDLSGSVDHNMRQNFFVEINTILNVIRPKAVRLIYFDCEVHYNRQFTNAELPLADMPPPEGGGGTSPDCVYDALEKEIKKGEKINCLIMLTDMEMSFGKAPPYPVLFVTESEELKSPYGQTIVM